MKTLKTLIKLHKKKLDDLLVQITDLEGQKKRLEKILEQMLLDAEHELQSHAATEYAFMLDQYLNYIRKQQKLCTKQITDLEKHIASLRGDLFDQFGELKKLEITLQKKQQAIKLAAEKAENKALDEMTILRYKRL